MTQIPPRGTPEFEEYKKHVEEAHKKGAVIEIDVLKGEGWEICPSPAFNAWHDSLYRIAPDQPQFTQAPEPSMTSTEQRIVKALDQIVYGLAEVSSITADQLDAGDARYNRLHDYTDKASQLVTALVADLPLPSPSEAPSEAVAPAVGAESALSVQVGGSHYKTLAIQPAEYTTRNGIGHLAGDAIGYITRYKSKGGKQDLEKAIHVLQLLIEIEYGKEQP